MNKSQFTVRDIPEAVYKRAESEALRTGRSLNSVFLDALKKVYNNKGRASKPFDRYIGFMSEEDARIIEEASREARELHPKDYL